MTALIICSTHAFCDITELERTACNRASLLHGLPIHLTEEDQASIVQATMMLEFLGSLHGSRKERRALVQTYLDHLNEEIWTASIGAHPSARAALMAPPGYLRPTGFVSEYPLLTTNLIRSSALLTSATRLGSLTVRADPAEAHDAVGSLRFMAQVLGVGHGDIDVLVAYERDFAAARSLGMRPRFVDEAFSKQGRRADGARAPTVPLISARPLTEQSALHI
ncbi:MAG: hypothetical protein AAFY97_02875 [Pseudomonadota bacterium]